MRTNGATPEERLENYEEQLESISSYITELKAMTAKCGTDKEQFEEDLIEAEHNIKFYESELTELKGAAPKLVKAAPKATPPPAAADTVLPRTAKQGLGFLILSSISFVAGAFLASKLKSRKAGKDAPDEKKGG